MLPETEGLEGLRITGVMISYYFICYTKLWLFAHHIGLEREHENVRIGKEIHESSYSRERKEVQLPGMKMDFIRKGDTLEIHEVKKSSRMANADRYQVLYYLYELRKRGIEADGIIHYPLLRETLHLNPTEDSFREIERIIHEIKEIVSGPFPAPVRKRICAKCAYYEFCFGGDV